MTILQSTRLTLIKSMPSIFDHKSPDWPHPEQSIGEECLRVGGQNCWLPIGPALAAFEVLSKDLQNLLDMHKDALKQGEAKPRAISFNMWMIGSKPESSNPTIVFSSKSLRQRAFAKALLKDSKLLDQYPGVKIKTLDRMPAIYRAGSQEPDTLEMASDRMDDVHSDDSEEAVHMIDNSRGSCGSLIAFGRSRLATMGGILLINGTYYGISAQHGRYDFLDEPGDETNEGNSLCFDDDSDTEDSDLENLVEITSRESISSYPDEGSSTPSFTSTASPKDEIFEYPLNFPRTTKLSPDHTPEMPNSSQPTYSANPKISMLLPCEKTDLDYEVFEINDARYRMWNRMKVRSSGTPDRIIFPRTVARTLVECPVWAATGTTGCVQGTMMTQVHYIKMEGSETFQEMWAVKLDRDTKPGDSGAWVVDSSGQLFGHIVAGDPMLGLAFIIPAYKIFDDIKSRFGEEPLLCPSPSVIQPFSAPNDGKVAEQPLLDWFQGKKTVSLTWFSGSPGADETALAQWYAPRNNFIGNGQFPRLISFIGSAGAGKAALARYLARHHLEEEFTKVKDIAEMMRKQGAEMIMANSLQIVGQEVFDERVALLEELTKLKKYIAEMMREERAEKRMANFLQTVVQEVADERTAFFRGYLSDYFSIVTGTFNELMPATFSDTAFSAKPPSFASIVPSIAYNYIDCNRETDGYKRGHEAARHILSRLDEALSDGDCILALIQELDTFNQRGQPLLEFPLHLVGRPKGSELMQETQSAKRRIPHCCRWFLPSIPRLPTNTVHAIPIADEDVDDNIAIASGQVDPEDGIRSLGIYKTIRFDRQSSLAAKLDLSNDFDIGDLQAFSAPLRFRSFGGFHSGFALPWNHLKQAFAISVSDPDGRSTRECQIDACSSRSSDLLGPCNSQLAAHTFNPRFHRRRRTFTSDQNTQTARVPPQAKNFQAAIVQTPFLFQLQRQEPNHYDQGRAESLISSTSSPTPFPDLEIEDIPSQSSYSNVVQPIRFSAAEAEDWPDLIAYLRQTGSGIVPIREARMQMQELHPLDQDDNPHWFTRRWISPDIPRLQPMRFPHLDSDPYHCGFCDAKHTDPRFSSFDRHLHIWLHILDTLQRDEDSGTENIESLSCYLVLLLNRNRTVPTYNTRQSRGRRLNAPELREDNSQCSETHGKA